MIKLEDFRDTFLPHFNGGKDKRWPAFEFIAEDLLIKCRPVHIVETGSIRWLGNYAGDGQSTVLWDWMVRGTGGSGITIDIEGSSIDVALASCPSMRCIKEDSILAIAKMRSHLSTVDLLYLDSYDWSEPTQHLSSLHHIGELAAAWEHLPSGCLIAVDDCFSATSGKHVSVLEFFRSIGCSPVVSGYIHVWRKP